MSAATKPSGSGGAALDAAVSQREQALRAGATPFAECPTDLIVPDAYRFAAIALVAAGVCVLLTFESLALLFGGLAVFVFAFFRNPERAIAGDARTVVSPADGRVLEVVEVTDDDGREWVRIGIFLSVFNVHVNRAPLAGKVVSVEKSGDQYLAAFDPKAASLNVRCDMTLETAFGPARVSQITGLIARRIVCHPEPGAWLERGMRYGLIRFGSRTDVWLPVGAAVQVRKGQKVSGGSSVLARIPELDDLALGSDADVAAAAAAEGLQ